MDPQRFWGTEPSPSATATAPAGETPGAPGQPTPGAATVPAAGVGTFPTGQQPTEPTPQESDADRAIREAREQLQRLAAERDQLRGTLGQVQQWAETRAQEAQRQQAESQYQQERDAIFTAAQNMGTDDAFRYIQQNVAALDQRRQRQIEELAQQSQQRVEQVARQFATPLWAQELARQHGLPQDAVQELLGYGDPEVMQRQAPVVAARYKKLSTLEEQLNQLARSQQAGQYVRQGAGMAGGQQAANLPLPESDDPDVRAMQILNQLRAGTYRR